MTKRDTTDKGAKNHAAADGFWRFWVVIEIGIAVALLVGLAASLAS
jgi:hypothetical protein